MALNVVSRRAPLRERLKQMGTIITGATGLVGRQLLRHYPNAVILSRNAAEAKKTLGDVTALAWQPESGPAPVSSLTGVKRVFNLAGESVAEGRWTAEKKRRIRDSRVIGTRNLVRGFATMADPPEVFVSASAVGFYGDRGDQELYESDLAGDGFLADVCQEWEQEALAAEALGIRVVCLRIGVVLAAGGGALAKMLTPFKMGVGGRLGSGKQWMPWIHIDDLVGLALHAASNQTMRGPINAVAPGVVTNAVFTKKLGQALHRPTFLPMPNTMLRLAFGEMSHVLLASQRVVPEVASRSGYGFAYPELTNALTSLLS